MNKEQMKDEITKLIEKYNQEKGKRYNEEATKKDFILPLFKILGWDVDNSNEVAPEDKVSRKRVDYAFKIDNIPKFYLEAKLLDENLDWYREKDGIKTTYAQQALNYAYYKGCTWALLTNFTEIRVYDAWTKDTASGFRFALRINDFIEDFDNGLYLLSREAFEQGLLDKKYNTKSRKKPITEQLLLDFTNFRAILSKDVYALNKSKDLTEEELDEAIQRLFDRLIFIRNCEDRELEPYELLSILRQWKENRKGTLVNKLRELFVHFDDTYNSKIFSKHLCDQVDISDNVLSRILDGLYTTEDGSIVYDFSLIDADVLGNIYEQYLGHILKKTEKRTKLTESKVKRKEEGIYYTPSYIVDYIVRNTVGELIKNKKTDVSKIKVLDPACGSGSFLIKTFDVLDEYYSKKEGYNQNKLDTSGTGTTYSTKLSILKDNIFGVDLDKQAVDIAQLNLLLKIAEKKRRLPILQQNIKNGNSLIDDPNLAGDNAFKWNEEFAEVMDNGGFDVVVGNPPYINIFNIRDQERKYFQQKYDTATNKSDTYAFFIEQAIKHLLKEGGYLGFIVSNTWTSIESFTNLRSLLLNNTIIEKLVPLELGVFSEATVVPIILIVRKESNKDKILKNKIKILSFSNGKYIVKTELPQKQFLETDGYVVSFTFTSKDKSIFDKLKIDSIPLGEIAKFSLGIKTADNDKFVSLNNTNKNSRKVLKGKYIKRYNLEYHNEWLLYEPDLMMQRKGAGPRKSEYFDVPKKIVLQEISGRKIIATLDTEKYFSLDTTNILYNLDNNYSFEFILGLLNSKLINFWYGMQFRGIHVKLNELRRIPIRKTERDTQRKVEVLVTKVLQLNKELNRIEGKSTDRQTELLSKIKQVEKEIDSEVYKIYGITKEEKKVIEENLK